MRVVICTGIYPPDVGGPATHAHDLRDELTARGHSVRVLTLSDSDADPRAECATVRRSLPWPLRLLEIVRWLVRNRRRYDVIYATGLHGPAVLGARLSRKPVVVKVVGDPAWERGRRLELTSAEFDAFQRQDGGSMRIRLMRWFRSRWSRSATAVTVPSEFLRDVVLGWGVASDKMVTIPNGVRVPGGAPPSVDRDGSLRLVFVGRLIRHKRLDLILDAISQIPEVELKIIGEGPQSGDVTSLRDRLGLRDRVDVVGRLDHGAVLDQLRAGDALVLASEYEGLPHVAVEALACGTPVIAPRVGGVHELVSSGENGLLYEPLTAESMRRSICRLAEDPSLLRRLSEEALRSTEAVRFERCAERIESLLHQASSKRPAVVMLGKSRAVRRGEPAFENKLRVMSRHLRINWISAGGLAWTRQDGTRLITIPTPDRPRRLLFYCFTPLLAIGFALREGAAVVCQSPFEAACVMALAAPLPRRIRPRIVVELHGDWRAMSRLYGSRLRRVSAPLADRVAIGTIRRADRVRVVSRYLETKVRETGFRGEVDRFMTWTDFSSFVDAPLQAPPDEPRAAFIGMLEGPKGADVLLSAWRDVSTRLPQATLTVLGRGSGERNLRELARALEIEDRVHFEASRSAEGVRQLLDESRCLVLPSRSEGLPRVVFEAMARSRAVVATTVGGIPEIVGDGESGALVPPDDPRALADALMLVLGDADLAERMGRAARERALGIDPLGEYEAGTERLASWVSAHA